MPTLLVVVSKTRNQEPPFMEQNPNLAPVVQGNILSLERPTGAQS